MENVKEADEEKAEREEQASFTLYGKDLFGNINHNRKD
jgi:hypothetical protein